MKFAYFAHPHIGGTYTVFKQLREGLAELKIEVRWLAMGRTESLNDPMWSSDLALGTVIDTSNLPSEHSRAKALAAELVDGGYDGVFINVLSDRLQTNLARYLPKEILRIMIVHNITAGTYAAAASIRDYVHATIGVSERIRSDLVRLLGFPEDRTLAIPHAADARSTRKLVRTPRKAEPLRIVFLGRIEDASKGVFWLPDILQGLDASIHLTVAGDGPDLPELRARLAYYANRVVFLGAVHPNEVHDLLLKNDVLIMPSRFEGFGLTLTEAMAVGCIPVVSRIRGVTDLIVDDGVNGFLFSIGNTKEAARIISQIATDPDSAQVLSRTARLKVETVFTIERMAQRYSKTIRQLGAKNPAIAPPLSFDNWGFPRGLRPGLRTFIPTPIKNWLRVIRERV